MKTIFAVFATALFLVGCAGTGHKLPKISNSDLATARAELSKNTASLPTYHRSDATYQSMVARINNRLLKNARPLCDHTGYQKCYFQTIYNPKDEANAYASDGYKITVFKGMLDLLETEDEIAAVISHEMGHHLANHNEEKAQNAAVGAVLTGVITAVAVGAASANNPYYSPVQQQQDNQAIEDMTQAGAAFGAISYSKEAEREADLLGAYLLSRAGYNLKRAERLYIVLTKMPGEDGLDTSSFLDTHPAGVERLAAWRKITEEVKNNKTKLPFIAEP